MRRVIADYQSEALDLTDPATFRDLSRPIGALDPKRLSFFKVRLGASGGSRTLTGTIPFLRHEASFRCSLGCTTPQQVEDDWPLS